MDEAPENDAVEIHVDHASEHNFWSGIEMDMSDGGVFVATHRPLDVGASVRVELNLPFEKAPVVVCGTVTWIRPHVEDSEIPAGVGVRFEEIEEDAIAKVRRFTETIREPIFWAA
jgi:uncharacterized protein (TIGR02266 family)